MNDRNDMLRLLRRFDPVFIGTLLTLMTAGCLFIFSASSELSGRSMFFKQMIWCVLGLGVFTAAALFDYRELRKFNFLVFGSSLLLLGLVFVPGIGKSVYGAHRWISLGGFDIQPSEIAKLSTIIMISCLLSDPGRELEGMAPFRIAVLAAGIPFLLIAAEPDLGTAMILLPLAAALLFCADASVKPLLIIAGLGILLLATVILWLKFSPDTFPLLEDYQKKRILVFLNVENDPLGAGWNKLQSQIAVGSGGLTGKGLLNGTQNILGFLPRTVAPTDFIFSVVAEETGFAGSAGMIGLFALLLFRTVRAAVRAADLLGRLLAAGVATLIFCHVFVNIAMTVGLLPITGLPLPLISYGGSFMLITMASLGLVQSVYARRQLRGGR